MTDFSEPYAVSVFLRKYGDCPRVHEENIGEVNISMGNPHILNSDLIRLHDYLQDNMGKLIFVRYKRVSASTVGPTSFGPAQIMTIAKSGRDGMITSIGVEFILRTDITTVPNDLAVEVQKTTNPMEI